MEVDKYQFSKKSQYLNLLILKDELQHHDKMLSGETLDAQGWLTKLRTTRSVFLTLNNVKDAADRVRVEGSKDFVTGTRELKKKLIFANHFRNRGIGHLNDTLLKRAVQWSPQIFYESAKENETFQLIESQRAIIESCINSFIDKGGVQKIFGTEIDLMYPPDARVFFSYLSEIVNETIAWLSEATLITSREIDHHTDDEVHELAAIAGQTNFNLKEDAEYSYSLEEHRNVFSKVIKELEEERTDPKILQILRSKFEI